MVYDIKVFDKHGNLKEVINGQECFNKIYEETAKSFVTERKKEKETFVCRHCNETFPKRSPTQVCCKKLKCRYQQGLINNPRKGGRDITCIICNKKATVTHGRAVTCGKECSAERNRRKNLTNGLSFRVKSKRQREQKRKGELCQK